MRILLLLTICSVLVSCKKERKETDTVTENQVDSLETKNKGVQDSLIPGTHTLSNEDFGETIDLKGKVIPVKPVFRVSESQMIATDSILFVKNRKDNYWFMAFSLPDFNLMNTFGFNGKGPNEFIFPKLVQTSPHINLPYVYDKGKFFSVNPSLQLKEISNISMRGKAYDNKQIYVSNDSLLYYVQSVNNTKAIFKYQVLEDSIHNNQIYDLAFSDDYNNWAAYIGDFGVNFDKERMVYAYKYFKRIMFMDLHTNTRRILMFDTEKPASENARKMLSPDNTTHYWGISPQKNHVYFLYSGRTPVKVHNEKKAGKEYIYVEQYDWNGNPVNRFKLDHWGYFCVNEDETKIFLLSTDNPDPFIVYDLPR
jgi:hypothetical protein